MKRYLAYGVLDVKCDGWVCKFSGNFYLQMSATIIRINDLI